MPTKPRTTKKPAAKPRRKITVGRNGIPKPATAEDIGRSGGDALDSQPRKYIPECSLGYAEQATSVRQSALNNAIDRLRAAISAAEVLTDNTHGRLQDVLSPPVPTAGGTGCGAPSNDSPLTTAINDFADRIYADSRRRNDILERLEL